MKRYFFGSFTALIVAAAIFLPAPGAMAARTCQENCKEFCCTDSKCTKEKQAECYDDCMRTCNNPQTETQRTTQPPPS